MMKLNLITVFERMMNGQFVIMDGKILTNECFKLEKI